LAPPLALISVENNSGDQPCVAILVAATLPARIVKGKSVKLYLHASYHGSQKVSDDQVGPWQPDHRPPQVRSE